MRAQSFYQAMTAAYQNLHTSDPIYNEFLVVETNTSFVIGHYTVVSRTHLSNIKWIGTQPKILYSTKDGSYSELQ